MQLQTYISDLLYRYDCVTLPDFGSFVTRQIPAELNTSTHTFLAPKKAILFNEQIKTNDGLLARYIADVEKIPFESANLKIANQVKRFKSELIQGEVINLQTIGELRFNDNSKIEFKPDDTVNYLPEAFGLQHIVSSKIERILEEEKITVAQKRQEEPNVISISETKKTNNSFLKYAAVGLVALTLGGFAGGRYYSEKIKTHNQLVMEEANEAIESKIQEATFVISNPLPLVKFSVEKKPTGPYHIIAGAYRVEENSLTKIEQLQDKGFKAHKIGVNKYGLHEVAYESYSDKLEALNALRTIKKTENGNAWLLVKALD
tara:strand:- start:26 stop:979 length:954 start_codon:yes stop_codon:yes gene_type:complete